MLCSKAVSVVICPRFSCQHISKVRPLFHSLPLLLPLCSHCFIPFSTISTSTRTSGLGYVLLQMLLCNCACFRLLQTRDVYEWFEACYTDYIVIVLFQRNQNLNSTSQTVTLLADLHTQETKFSRLVMTTKECIHLLRLRIKRGLSYYLFWFSHGSVLFGSPQYSLVI